MSQPQRRPTSETHLLQRAGTLLGGRYRVKELLGVGAMGSVWTAEHLALRRDVVVKFHEEAFLSDRSGVALQRFLRESRILSSLHHRNVAQYHESGTTSEGEPYLIMELLRGRSLAQRLRADTQIPDLEARGIAIALAEGLEAVHQAGVLHRDIKPENVYLHEDEEEGRVVPKILDFGLALPHAGERLTLGNVTLGTPGYMAPEQARGRALDVRADVYSLGVVLYEMLSGALPVEGATPRELMIAAATKDPSPLTALRPDLAGPWSDTVMQAVARDPAKRTADVRALRDALRALPSPTTPRTEL